MDENKLIEEIGRQVRREDADERRRFDDRWRRLSAGTISEEDDAALRTQAETSEETRLDYEALRPLDQEFKARLVEQWQARTRDAAPAEHAAPSASEPASCGHSGAPEGAPLGSSAAS